MSQTLSMFESERMVLREAIEKTIENLRHYAERHIDIRVIGMPGPQGSKVVARA